MEEVCKQMEEHEGKTIFHNIFMQNTVCACRSLDVLTFTVWLNRVFVSRFLGSAEIEGIVLHLVKKFQGVTRLDRQ